MARTQVLLLALVLLASALPADAFVMLRSAAACKAASVGTDGSISACISQFGDVRLSCGTACRSSESTLSWNQQGPAGEDGLVADTTLQCPPGEFVSGFTVTSGVASVTCVPTGPQPTASPTPSPTPTPTLAPTATPTTSPTDAPTTTPTPGPTGGACTSCTCCTCSFVGCFQDGDSACLRASDGVCEARGMAFGNMLCDTGGGETRCDFQAPPPP